MRIRVVLSLVACAALVAACGGSGSKPKSGTASYGPASSPYAMSKCMRDNGLTNFPDPQQGSGGVGFPGGVGVGSDGVLTVDGATFSGPALKHAETACKRYLPPTGPPPPLSAAQHRQALRFSECMRANGVPSFPDPPTSAPTPHRGQRTIPGSDSPAFAKASETCLKATRGPVQVP